MTTKLCLIFGDQLSHSITSLQDFNPSQDTVLLCEVNDEATYVQHHKKKIAFIFSAMRHFAQELRQKGITVRYIKLNDADNTGSFRGEIKRAIAQIQPDMMTLTTPSEFRVLQEARQWSALFNIPIDIRQDDRFLCTTPDFEQWAKGRQQLRMEYFYREMRKKYGLLMDGDQPVGGQWNFDQENRKIPKTGIEIPKAYTQHIDEITQACLDVVEQHMPDHFGDLLPFYFAVTREQALAALHQFIDERLIHFGDYQDAMIEGEPWMYHSHLSFYINCGLLLPLECVQAAEQAYMNQGAPLNAVEGFIRQIIGWREFVRGIYWLKMPDYAQANFLNATRALPKLYWGQPTKMNCLQQCVQETKQNAYAHHIQRLMILGNFALLAGIHPDEVNHWFLVVYADAYEWVELPNVTGMILFADAGLLSSKPYAASGAYINRMSNYCKNCDYAVSKKNGQKACPFNYLYWDFLMRNEQALRRNPRLAMPYRTFDRMTDEKKQHIKDDARFFFSSLED